MIAEVAAEERGGGGGVSPRGSGSKQKKRKREEGEPKGVQSAYLMFCASVRESVKSGNPAMKITDQAKIIATRWQALSQKEKQKFDAQAIKDKQRYTTGARASPRIGPAARALGSCWWRCCESGCVRCGCDSPRRHASF